MNGDGDVDVEDVNIIINIILEKDVAVQLMGTPDIDFSGTVDVADVNALINIILTQ